MTTGPRLYGVNAVVADDMGVIRSALARILKLQGINVVGSAEDGRAAVELCELHRPEVVFLDISMSDYGGLDALRSIRVLGRPTRVVMLTGEASMKSVNEALDAGADAYMLKPFTAAQIIATLKKLGFG